MLLQGRNSLFRRTIFPYIWFTLVFRDKRKRALMYFKRRPSMIVGTQMETSHCLNHGSVWHDSRCSAEIHQKDFCGFKADWRRNRSQQTRKPCGQKNVQSGHKSHSVKPQMNRQEKNQTWTRQENNEAIILFPTMILVTKSWTVPEEIWKHCGLQRCFVKSPANPNGSSWRRPCASDW